MKFIKKKTDASVFDTKKIAVKELELILTQKCNLACAHCMRGDCSPKEINEDTLKNIFKKIHYVENLSLGGGEPSLAPHVVRKITQVLKENDVIVKSVNFTSNGTTCSDEFIEALLELKEYLAICTNKKAYFTSKEETDLIYACFSFDDFHISEIIDRGFQIEQIYENVAKYQNALSEKCSIECRVSCDVDIYNSGRAKQIKDKQINKVRPMSVSDWKYPYILLDETIIVGGVMTISCDGEIVPPNIPFKDEKIFSFGNINTQPLSRIFKNMKIINCNAQEFEKNTDELFKKLSTPQHTWKRYLKAYGHKKLDIFFAYVNQKADLQKQ